MMIILILIIIYILSFLRMYFWIRNAYGENGVFYKVPPEKNDFLFTVIPVVNTFASIIITSYSLTGKKIKINIDYMKFFKLK